MTPLVLYTAAHGGFEGLPVPLGGGAAVCQLLLSSWELDRPFRVRLLDPSILGAQAPSARDIVSFSEGAYARFCRQFSDRSTGEILRHDPASAVVLANDIAEGPDFELLASRGFPIHTIFHVDVVAYIASVYLRGRVRPEQLTAWARRLGTWWMPAILRLIFDKQRGAMCCSRSVIVPSAAMKETLTLSYPGVNPDKIIVLPWGIPPQPYSSAELSIGAGELRLEFGVPRDALVLLTLSRISPEKGHDLLVRALIEWEESGDLPSPPLWLFVCGEAAFMQGRKFLGRVRRLAGRLQRIKVVFPGYVTGLRKQAFFHLANLYLFPSRHESYGLTLMEAMQAGLPAVCLDHGGARELMGSGFAEIVQGEPVAGLHRAVQAMLADPVRLRELGVHARQFALARPFSVTARALADRILRCRG